MRFHYGFAGSVNQKVGEFSSSRAYSSLLLASLIAFGASRFHGTSDYPMALYSVVGAINVKTFHPLRGTPVLDLQILLITTVMSPYNHLFRILLT